jgi:hypothetical protein
MGRTHLRGFADRCLNCSANGMKMQAAHCCLYEINVSQYPNHASNEAMTLQEAQQITGRLIDLMAANPCHPSGWLRCA